MKVVTRCRSIYFTIPTIVEHNRKIFSSISNGWWNRYGDWYMGKGLKHIWL